MLAHLTNDEHVCTDECRIFPDLKEFLPPLKFINSIPAQGQKGFRNIDIIYTCVDACEQFLAVGTNVGIVYLFDQKNEKLHKLRNNNYKNQVTSVKLLVSLECLVALGSKNGTVIAFKVPFDNDHQVEQFVVKDLHTSSVTSIAWSKNGIKLFTGDANGTVVCTEIDHLEHQSRSYIALEEKSEIVQLVYHNLVLLVSTLQRSLLYFCEKNEIIQVGQKDRKCPGKFGATFFTAGREEIVYACRPGQHIWKSSMKGVTVQTIILKSALNHPHHSISFQHAASANSAGFENFQCGPLKVYNGNLLLTWSDQLIVIIHPDSGIVTSICGFNSIVDVATWKDEIYVLQGIRHLLRLAVSECNWVNNNVEEESNAVHGNDQCTATENTSEYDLSRYSLDGNTAAPKFVNWFRRKFSDAAVVDYNENLGVGRIQRAHTDAVHLPDIVELDKDLAPIHVFEKEVPLVTSHKEGEKTIAKESADEIVYRPRVKKKKKKKKNRECTSEGTWDAHPDSAQSSATKELNASVNATEDAREQKHSTDFQDAKNDCPDTGHKQSNIDGNQDFSIVRGEENEAKQLVHHDDNIEETVEALGNVRADADSECAEKCLETAQTCRHSQPVDPAVREDDQCEDTGNIFDIYANSGDGHNENGNVKVEKTLDNSSCCKLEEEEEEEEKDSSGLVSSSSSSRETRAESINYGSDWFQYNGPGPIVSLAASNHHLFCVDNHECLYISDFPVLGLTWKRLQQPAEQIAVSPSEHIVWALYKGTVYALKRKSKELWENLEWIGIARDIYYVAVDDCSAWYISSGGRLTAVKELSVLHPYSYPWHVDSPFEAVQVACRKGVVWALTNDSRVFCRCDSSSGEGKQWKEVRFPQSKSISMFSFGCDGTVFIVCADGTLWFRTGVSVFEPSGDSSLWEVDRSGYLYQVHNHRRTVMKVFESDILSSLIYTQYSPLVASSEAGLWYCKQMDAQLYSNQKSVAGHLWKIIVPEGTVTSLKWTIVAAEGVVNSQGVIWGHTTTCELFCFMLNVTFTSPIMIELPTSKPICCIVPKADSLWVLSSDGSIYLRREMSKKCPQGLLWQKLDTTQLADSTLCHISCSTNTVWACDREGIVYFRVGSLNPVRGTTLSQAWVEVDSDTSSSSAFMEKLSDVGKHYPLPVVHSFYKKTIIRKVYVGCNPSMVWAIDDKQNVYARGGITDSLLVGKNWIPVPSPHAMQLCISSTTVWLLKSSGKIFRRFGITKNNITGDYWKQVPGKLSCLSVTDDDELWGIHDDSLCRHFAHMLHYQNPLSKNVDVGVISDDEWEDVMAGVSD